MKYRDASPFFVGINQSKVWAIELFCDHCPTTGPECKSAEGLSPLMYAAKKGMDDICMYLSLRTDDVDEEDEQGMTVFQYYLEKKDITHMKQLLRRGADINYYFTKTGLTPLHVAIEHKFNSKLIKFLLSYGADPHHEDKSGLDCCDKAKEIPRYFQIKELREMKCKQFPSLRKCYDPHHAHEGEKHTPNKKSAHDIQLLK